MEVLHLHVTESPRHDPRGPPVPFREWYSQIFGVCSMFRLSVSAIGFT